MVREIFKPDGVYPGALAIPAMLIDQIGLHYIAGRTVDGLGVERIVVLGLDRS